MKSRKGCKTGGGAESPKSGDKEFEADLKSKPAEYNKGEPEKEAEERKAGGRVGHRSYRSYEDMDAGAGSGLGRLEKTEIQSRR